MESWQETHDFQELWTTGTKPMWNDMFQPTNYVFKCLRCNLVKRRVVDGNIYVSYLLPWTLNHLMSCSLNCPSNVIQILPWKKPLLLASEIHYHIIYTKGHALWPFFKSVSSCVHLQFFTNQTEFCCRPLQILSGVSLIAKAHGNMLV